MLYFPELHFPVVQSSFQRRKVPLSLLHSFGGIQCGDFSSHPVLKNHVLQTSPSPLQDQLVLHLFSQGLPEMEFIHLLCIASLKHQHMINRRVLFSVATKKYIDFYFFSFLSMSIDQYLWIYVSCLLHLALLIMWRPKGGGDWTNKVLIGLWKYGF